MPCRIFLSFVLDVFHVCVDLFSFLQLSGSPVTNFALNALLAERNHPSFI